MKTINLNKVDLREFNKNLESLSAQTYRTLDYIEKIINVLLRITEL
jgi:hypothetical protein